MRLYLKTVRENLIYPFMRWSQIRNSLVSRALWDSLLKRKILQSSPSVQFSSVAQSCLTLCNPMNRSTPGLPVHHQLPEFTQTHVHRVRAAIQPSHPGSSPSPPAHNPSQHQSLFQWVNSSHEVAKVLELQLYHHSFQRNPRADLPQNGLAGSPCSPRDSQESSPTPQFKSINYSVHSFPYSSNLTSIQDYWKKDGFDYMDLSWQSNVSAFYMLFWLFIAFFSKEQVS